jgi:hypothetical protein
MRPLSSWQVPRAVVGVFTDIDDTLTTDGAITPDALQALADLKAAGLHVVPITGRPVGWSEPFATSWPVDAIVAENGAVGLQHTATHGLRKLYQQNTATRTANFARMQQVLAHIERTVPGAGRSRDNAGRETDIAIDHSEFTQLTNSTIAEVVGLMRDAGMTATVSSIHINGWFGLHSKLTGARWIVRKLWGRDLDAEIDRWVYVGDSTNDQVMFKHFENSIGVANIRCFESQLTDLPSFITPGERGAGFAQAAHHLLRTVKKELHPES